MVKVWKNPRSTPAPVGVMLRGLWEGVEYLDVVLTPEKEWHYPAAGMALSRMPEPDAWDYMDATGEVSFDDILLVTGAANARANEFETHPETMYQREAKYIRGAIERLREASK